MAFGFGGQGGKAAVGEPRVSDVVPRDGTMRALWRLLVPFWVSREWWKAWGLLLLQLVLIGVNTWTAVWFNNWIGDFTQSIVNYDLAGIGRLLVRLCWIALAVTLLAVITVYARAALKILWRKFLTEYFLERWTHANRFYRIELEGLVDNPDQRISQDVNQFIEQSTTLIIGGIGTVVGAVTFGALLWGLSGVLHVSMFGHEWSIKGYVLYASIAYSIIITVAAYVFGRRLMPLTFEQEHREADFRFQLAGVREYAEQIALYHGGEAERRQGRTVFRALLDNLWRIVFFNMRFESFTELVGFVTTVIPMVLALPQYFAHQIAFGTITRMGGAFQQLNGALSWFVNNFSQIQLYRATIARLDQLDWATRVGLEGDFIAVRAGDGDAIIGEDLRLDTPDGRVLVTASGFSIGPGERWLIQGRSGAGKSTLMRALAGIWPYGCGSISLPQGRRFLFLSQRNYIPRGTLKAAICYPAKPELFDDELCEEILIRCELPRYVRNLYKEDRWSHRLSPGEQQRASIARVLIQRPDFVLLDESTSALDGETERKLYQAMIDELPGSTFVSISHHDTLNEFHTRILRVLDDGRLEIRAMTPAQGQAGERN